MRKMLLATGIVLASVFGTISVRAEEKETVDWKKVAELGDGIQRVQTDDKGVVKSFVAVGTSRISKALGVVKGKKMAQKRARLQAKAEIVKWLKGNVKPYEASADEGIIIQLGDGSGTQDTGKGSESSTTRIEEIAEGIVRGTTVIYSAVQTIDDEQEYIVILGWSAKNARRANQVQEIMNEEPTVKQTSAEPPTQPADTTDTTAATSNGKPKMLPEKEIVSDEASEF